MGGSVQQRPLLVIGGRSQVGFFLRRRLLALGKPVLALSRRPPAPPQGRWQWLPGALGQPLPALPPLAGVISAGPLAALVEWLAGQPALECPRVVATSSMSADSKQNSPVPAERALAAQLTAAEQRLAQVARAQGRDWCVLRPTLIYGAGLDRSLSPIARRAARWRLFPQPPGHGLRQPVHADDVAAALLAAWQTPAAAGQILACGGGERLPAAAMFERVRRSLPGPCLGLPIPRLAVRTAAILWPARAGMLGRLEQDLIADNQPLETVLGLRPRAFAPAAHCWWPEAEDAG